MYSTIFLAYGWFSMQFCKLLMIWLFGFIPLLQLERNSGNAPQFCLMKNLRYFLVLNLYAFIETNRKSNRWNVWKCFGANQHVYYWFHATIKFINFSGDYPISLKQMETSCSMFILWFNFLWFNFLGGFSLLLVFGICCHTSHNI